MPAPMPSGRAGSLESLRRLNRLRVIHALRDQGKISRADIARRTGLSRSTVSSLVADLQADGLVGSSAILPGWIGVAAGAEMRARLDLPVMVDNDANLGALAEAAFGAGRDAGDLIYLKVSSGIGAGLILNGRLYRGSTGLAGELGHVLVDPDGIVCRCGNRGCLETVAATGALVDLLRRSHGEDLTVQAMVDHAQAGDAGCRRVIPDAGRP